MTSYVLTLIGNAESAPLEPAHIERVFRCLGSTAETDWLAEREACDLFIKSSSSAESITEKARDVLSGDAIDAVCTLAEGRRNTHTLVWKSQRQKNHFSPTSMRPR